MAEEKSLLSPENVEARLAFAQSALRDHPDPEYWQDVIFTDEKTFDTSSHERQIVYR